MSDLQKLILATISYYDLFDFALTAEEIKQWLVAPGYLKIQEAINFDLVDVELYSLVNGGKILSSDGHYVLPLREHLVPLRVRRNKIATQKMRHARRAVKIISLVPFVQAVFASGSLALGNTDYDSDLDIFIVTKPGHIWTARFITNVVFDILHWKRKPQDRVAPDKLCLNHWVTENSLRIENQNVFTARIYSHLVPLYLQNPKVVQNFEKDNNWIYLYVNQWNFSKQYLVKKNSFLNFNKKFKELILGTEFGVWIESLSRSYQVRRIKGNPLTRDPHGRIEYNNYRLEFHPWSIEETIINSYQNSLNKIS